MAQMRFSPETEHLDSLLARRDQIVAQRIELGIQYLDDALGGIYPNDLMVIGADTGVGKTELAVSTAISALAQGKRVHMFALEAEVGEVSSRLYFQALGRRAKEPKLDFGGWRQGKWKELDQLYGKDILVELKDTLGNLQVLYKRKGEFTPRTLHLRLIEIQEQTDMVILDHLHVIDSEGENDWDSQTRAIQVLRDMALNGLPVLAISHVRKKERGQPRLLPGIEDIHGASSLTKVATQVVLLARDWDATKPAAHLSVTLAHIPKDRKGRATSMVAKMYFDTSCSRYMNKYGLGRLTYSQDERRTIWQELNQSQLPHWAKEKEDLLPF